MTRLKLHAMNMNLLVALDALLAEKNVSRAAARVGVSQPAMSQNLRQLRTLLEDPLLVRDRGAMVLTPAAAALATPLRRILVELERVLNRDLGFDPARATRRFALAAGDHIAVTLLPELLERLQAEAPGIEIAVRPIDGRRILDLLATGEVDIAIGAEIPASAEVRRMTLYSSGFRCLVRHDHPEIGAALDIAQYTRIPHALISSGSDGKGAVDTALQALGLSRRITLRIASFVAAPVIVSRCDLILTAPTRLAQAFAKTHPLRLLMPPIELPTHEVAQVWHERDQRDPAHAWLRSVIHAATETGA